MIQASGPISVATYMDLCLHDRRHGYYATRPGLGEDFITAPEISQIFGELIGLWAAQEWQSMGSPEAINLIEIGPGRGTLMDDALRASQKVDGFHDAVQLCFIEPSPVLRADLDTRFGDRSPQFISDIADIAEDKPFILIGNEWLDCLPVQQWLRVGDAWHERVIGISDEAELTFGLNPMPLPQQIQPTSEQASIEIQPGLKTLCETLQPIMEAVTGRALFIDYGPGEQTPEDSLRSYQTGQQVDPLCAPGESDLTCDVDFRRLAQLATDQGLQVDGPISQSQFLLSLGAETRLNQLAKAHPDQAEDLHAGIVKLVDPRQMGTKFRVFSMGSPHLPVTTGF